MVTIMSMVIPTLRVGNDARKLIVVRAGFHLRREGGGGGAGEASPPDNSTSPTN